MNEAVDTMFKTTMKFASRLTLLFTALVLASCTRPSAQLTVVNGSTATLTNIVASGAGFSVPLAPLAPGAQQKVAIDPRPRDRAGFTLDFDADGKHYSLRRAHDNWAGFKEVIITVAPDFTMTDMGVTTF